MDKLLWKHEHQDVGEGFTGKDCEIDTYETCTEILESNVSLFALEFNINAQRDISTGEMFISTSYSPYGAYCDMYLPVGDTYDQYTSVEEAKEACEEKAKEILKSLYRQLEAHINRLSC